MTWLCFFEVGQNRRNRICNNTTKRNSDRIRIFKHYSSLIESSVHSRLSEWSVLKWLRKALALTFSVVTLYEQREKWMDPAGWILVIGFQQWCFVIGKGGKHSDRHMKSWQFLAPTKHSQGNPSAISIPFLLFISSVISSSSPSSHSKHFYTTRVFAYPRVLGRRACARLILIAVNRASQGIHFKKVWPKAKVEKYKTPNWGRSGMRPVIVMDAPDGSLIGSTHPNPKTERLEAASKAEQPSPTCFWYVCKWIRNLK